MSPTPLSIPGELEVGEGLKCLGELW